MSDLTTVKISKAVLREVKLHVIQTDQSTTPFVEAAILEKIKSEKQNKNANKKEKPKNGPKAGRGKAKG